MRIVTSKEMGSIDKAAQFQYNIPAIVLMENAGRKSFDWLVDRFQDLPNFRVIILVGNGNNGGDGLVIARHLLLEEACQQVDVVLLNNKPSEPENRRNQSRSELNQVHLEIIGKLGINTHSFPNDQEKVKELLQNSNLVIDSLLGVGVRNELRTPVKKLLELVIENSKEKNLQKSTPPIHLALDLPTGIGHSSPLIFPADHTHTYGLPKQELYYPKSRTACGEIVFLNPGFPSALLDTPTPTSTPTTELSSSSSLDAPNTSPSPGSSANLQLVTPELTQSLELPYQDTDYKKTRGRVAILAGSHEYLGAGILSAQAAQKTGSGLTTLFCFRDDFTVQAERIPPSIILKDLDSLPTGEELANHFDAILVGPGWGKTPGEERSRALDKIIKLLNSSTQLPVVFDADGLYWFKEYILESILPELKHQDGSQSKLAILTPHIGEMSQLTGLSTETVLNDPYSVMESLQTKFKAKLPCYLLLKCHLMYLMSSNYHKPACYVFDQPNPYLGTGGAGDVLAGMITSRTAYHFLKEGGAGVDNGIILATDQFQQTGLELTKEKQVFTMEELIERL